MQNVFSKLSMFAVVVSGASLAGVADADAEGDQCVKLDAHINYCSDYPPNQCPLFETLTFTQQRNYWHRNLSDPGGAAEVRAACKAYYDSISLEGTIATAPAEGGYAEGGDCYLDGSHHMVVDARVVQRERHCDLVLKPKNPYHKLATGSSYQRGTQFQNRADIIAANKKRPIHNVPQLPGQEKVQTDVPDIDDTVVLAHFTAFPDPADDLYYNEGATPPSRPQSRDDYANIDHIIPRVDIQGCGCGTNSPLNAAVISRGLNNSMSNNMWDPERIEVLRKFTNYNDIFGPPP